MNRRSFLRALASGIIAAATVDVDRLLWEPGKKTIFLPSTTPLALSGPQVDIAIRFIKQYDVGPFPVTRLDVLYGWKAVRPDLAVRILSS